LLTIIFWEPCPNAWGRDGEFWLFALLLADQVLRFDGVMTADWSFSFTLFRLKGLWKKPLFFLRTCFSGACCFVGEVFPLGGSWLEKEVGLEYSLLESRLDGLARLTAELRSEGGPVRHSMVIPSCGYGS
jgi:hypothetical protein